MRGFFLKIARFCFSRATLAILCLLVAFSATWFWACEVWQRPDPMLYWDEGWMLAAAVAGFSTGGVLLSNPRRASGIRRACMMVMLSGLAFAGICVVAHITAVQGLMRHRVVVSPNPLVTVLDEMNGTYVTSHPTGINEVLSRFHYQDVPLDHLLEASRWRVRMAFLRTIITDEKHATMAARDWHRLFPAVIGQDVKLARRHQMMRVLDKMVRNESVSAASRNAAVFWMGLVVLTDTESFAAERERVCDMMLASKQPPMSLTGDVWMRVLNSLLALDGPEKVAEISKVLARDRMLLRRAVREGVRGMENQVEAVMREIDVLDAAGERTAAAALWLDLRLLMERADKSHARDTTRNWLGDKLVMWLTEDSNSVRKRFKDERNRASFEDFMLEMTEQMRAKLAAYAMRVLESAPSQPKNIGSSQRHPRYVPPAEVEHALLIRNFLDAGDREMVSGRIATIMIEHIRFVTKQERTIDRPLLEMTEMIFVLLNVWDDLDDGIREQINSLLLEQMAFGKYERNIHALGIAYYLLRVIDGNSQSPRISGAERLAAQVLKYSHVDWGRRCWWGVARVRETQPITPKDVDDFMDAFLKAANSDKKTFQLNPRPHGLWFDKDRLRKAMGFDAWTDLHDNGARARNLIRLSLIQLRVIGYEHLPEDWPGFFHAERRAFKDDRAFPDEPYWAPLIVSPSGTQAMLDHFDVPNDYVLLGLLGFLEKYQPKPGIKEVILSHFKSRLSSGVRSQRVTAFRVMLKLSHWLEADERIGFRGRLLGFFRMDRPTLDEWCHTMMLPMDPQHDYPRQYAIMHDQCRSEWIEWQEDELSALLSWSCQIHHELSMLPHDWRLYPDRSLFMYLNTYMDACDANPWTGLTCEPAGLDVALSKRFRRHLPPDAPFEATPWQRAREMHLRNPSLDFHDRALFRPNIRR